MSRPNPVGAAEWPQPAQIANAYPASRMSPVERRAELCRILALGVVRLQLRQSSIELPTDGESSLHFGCDQSGGGAPSNTGAMA